MEENEKDVDFKKVIYFLIIFAVVSLGITIGMIIAKNNSYSSDVDNDYSEYNENNNTNGTNINNINSNNNISNSKSDNGSNNIDNKEDILAEVKYKYDENNLTAEDFEHVYINNIKILEKNYNSDEKYKRYEGDKGLESKKKAIYPEIDGLKNKVIQKEINKKIEEIVFDNINTQKDIVAINSNVGANFSNILSIRFYIEEYNLGSDNYLDYGTHENREIIKTFELVTGKEIRLEDCFRKNTSIKNICMPYLYNSILEKHYWDVAKYDENYYPIVDPWNYNWAEMDVEDEIYKTIKKVENGKCPIYISNKGYMKIKIDELYQIILPWSSYINELTFFKKFITNESIFDDKYENKLEVWCLKPTSKIYNPKENLFVYFNNIYKLYWKEKTTLDECYWQYYDEDEYKYEFKSIQYKKLITSAEEYAQSKPDVMHLLVIQDNGIYRRELPIQEYKDIYEKQVLDIIKDDAINSAEIFSSDWYEYYDGTGWNAIDKMEYLINDRGIYGTPGKYEIIYYISEDNMESGVIWLDYEEIDISKNVLTNDSLTKYSMEELNYLYNAPFAKYGHDFKSKSLKNFFNVYPWYCPVYNKIVSLEELSDIEKQNLQIIKKEIDSRKEKE